MHRSIKGPDSRSSEFEREIRSKCVGAPISVQKTESGWAFRIGDEIVLSGFLVWRLLGPQRIELSGEDHGHRFGLSEAMDVETLFNEQTSGSVITGVTLNRVTGDLTLELSDEHKLEVLVTSRGYECWTIHEGNDFLGAGASGGVV